MKEFIKKRLKESLEVIPESSIIKIENISPDADKITNTILLPYVKDLFYGINKVKRGDLDKLKPNEKERIKSVFPNLLNKRKKVEDFNIPYDKSLMPLELENIYTVKKIKGGEIPVSVAFYYDQNYSTTLANICGNNDVICVNAAGFELASINKFKSLMRHELIHIADPKVSDEKVASRLYKKYSGSSDNDIYHKLPYEFDSWSHEIISTIDDNFKLIKDPEYKKYMQAKLWELLTSFNNQDYFDIYHEYKNSPIMKFFVTGGLKSKRMDVLSKIFTNYLNVINSWSTKPTLFKTFLKRMARVVPYTKF